MSLTRFRLARLPFALLILSATSFLGFGKSATSEAEVSSKLVAERRLSGTPLTAAERERRTQDYAVYLQRRLLAAYERAGVKNPRWNEKFLALVDRVAKDRAGIRGIPLKEIRERIQELSELGCTDPHFRYIKLRFEPESAHGADLPQHHRATGKALRDSGYDACEKFWVTVRTANLIKEGAGKERPAEVVDLLHESLEQLTRVLADPTSPSLEINPMVDRLLTSLETDKAAYQEAFARIEPLLVQNWPNDPNVLQTRGRAHIDLAWFARGNGMGSTVTSAGWKQFESEISKAEVCLTDSWKNGPLSRTARHMIRVELAQGEGRERMELWFGRALELNPADYDTCVEKLWYLMPRWHGEHADLLEFGRECIVHPTWKGEVPLTLMRAHEYVAGDLPRSKRGAYWQDPKVWAEVKQAYERFFELNPRDIGWRHNYAKAAWRSLAWKDLNQQVPLLGEINYTYFGGREEFDRMVAEGRAGEGRGPVL